MKKKSVTKKKKPAVKKMSLNALVRRRFSQHPSQFAWREFKYSDEYKRLTNGSTIRLPKDCEIYLANRIATAWTAGRLSAEKIFA